MRVLTVNCYFPMYSTGKLIKALEDELSQQDVEFFHCYEAGEKYSGSNALRLSGWFEYRVYYYMARITGNRYGTGVFSTKRLLNKIAKWQPDVVHIHCPNASSVNLYQLLDYLKKNDIPTVITHHAEFFYTGNCPHAYECKGYMEGCLKCPDFHQATESYFINRTKTSWKKMKEVMDGAKFVSVCVSKWQAERCRNSVICGGLETHQVGNGIDTENTFFYKEDSKLENKFCPNGEKIVLHVTAQFTDDANSNKGGAEILKLAKMYENDRNVKFIVIGRYYLSQDNLISKNITFLGEVKDQDMLSKFYSLADVTVITSKRETFGLVCAESLCCGTPVVGYKCGGMETIAIDEYTDFVSWGDVEKLYDAVNKWLTMDEKKYTSLIEKEAKQRYSIGQMAQEYYNLYKQIVAEK